MAWQTIETAPRDGTWFMICNADDGEASYEVGRFDPYTTADYVETETGTGLYKKVEKPCFDWRGFNNFHRATHWQSVPRPPAHQ